MTIQEQVLPPRPAPSIQAPVPLLDRPPPQRAGTDDGAAGGAADIGGGFIRETLSNAVASAPTLTRNWRTSATAVGLCCAGSAEA
jgi:hypothetical protein